tara:strand:+ start:1700 stop:2458 length:759 start_codon:yes stop_codon:yes gene_type:complete
VTALLELDQVCLAGFDGDRLESVTLRLRKGERVALLGRSGAGKSSLIAVANGSLPPAQGRVLFQGELLEQLSRRQRARIGTLWQDLRLVEELSIAQNVNAGALGRRRLPWALANLLFRISTEACRSCLRQAGLEESLLADAGLDRPVGQLSGGQRQRVALARLFRQQPDLLLADEPLASLDPAIAAEVLDRLLTSEPDGTLRSGAQAVVVSLHRPELIDRFDRVLGLRAGRLVMDTSAGAVSDADLRDLYAP